MGACSSKPKTAEFEAVVSNLYNPDALQLETKKKSLEHELQYIAGCADSLEGHIHKEQKVISLCSTQNQPSVKNTHGYAQVAFLESERNAGKTRINEACDAYDAIHGPYQVMPSCMKADNDHKKTDTHTIWTSTTSSSLEVEGREAVLTESSARRQPSSTVPLLGAAGDGEGSSLHAFAANYTVSSCHIKCLEPEDQHDDTQVVSKKESSALNRLKLSTIGESSTNPSELTDTPQEPEHANKQEEEMQRIEAVQPVYNNVNVVSAAMDQMLENLASEFERQESLSSYSLGVVHP